MWTKFPGILPDDQHKSKYILGDFDIRPHETLNTNLAIEVFCIDLNFQDFLYLFIVMSGEESHEQVEAEIDESNAVEGKINI